MQYMISFLEGIITFISPCLLPFQCSPYTSPILQEAVSAVQKKQ